MINALINPLQKQLQKETTAFNARMTSIRKQTKGEKIPADIQKELDGVLEKGVKAMKSKTSPNVKPNSDAKHKDWINILSMGG